MNTDRAICPSKLLSRNPFLAKFAKEEDGVMTVLACCIILMMMLIGGIGVDLMHNEMHRVHVQNIADRAVLAAADLDQKNDPETIVRDYFKKSHPPTPVKSVKITKGKGFRTVFVDASTYTNTAFMDFLGTETLPVTSMSTAEERVRQVEISMILDISGSMGNNGKMGNLKDAAKTFVDTVITEDSKDRVSISLVPYSAHVNAGKAITSKMKLHNRLHNFSECVDFDNADFSTTALDLSKSYRHMQHFQYPFRWNFSYKFQVNYPSCTPEDFATIRPISRDTKKIKEQISQFQPRVQTSIFLGMKWGTALLDPSFNKITKKLVQEGSVDEIFKNRPTQYSARDVQKTIVLMTDGENTVTRRISDQYYANTDHAHHWSRYNAGWFKHRIASGTLRNNLIYNKYTGEQGNVLLDRICTAAKNKGIIVWAIGFEVKPASDIVMSKCASSPSHYFSVSGSEIEDAFKSIADQINQLRLIQ